MKKLLCSYSIVLFIIGGCSEDIDLTSKNAESQNLQILNHTKNYTSEKRNCLTVRAVEAQLRDNPGLAKKMEMIEAHTRNYLAAKKENVNKGGGKGKGNGGGGSTSNPTPYEGVIHIPVVVHILYNNETENISEAQIQSQIDVLNADFNAQNGDLMVPVEFESRVADVGIEFSIAKVIRKYTSNTSWTTNNYMMYDSRGGSGIIDPSHYLNIWVCNLTSALGYAYYPGGYSATDGVVVKTSSFGSTGYVKAPYHLGRTAVHEVGHWLNLRHIWGDGSCSVDDLVSDTPVSDGPNFGCPGYPSFACSNAEMTMNFMDYTNDPCMVMFSQGQKERMRALFASGGIRESFVLTN